MVDRINPSSSTGASSPARAAGAPVPAPPPPQAPPRPPAGSGRPGDGVQLAGPVGRAAGVGLPGGSSDADYVKNLYRTILGREADPGGLQHHLALLGQGMDRGEMAAAIGASQERRNRDAEPDETFVRNLHRELLNREPSAADVAQGTARLQAGLGRDDLIRNFLARPDYVPADTNQDRLRPGGPAGPAGQQPGPAAPAPNGLAAPGEQRVTDGGGGFLWKPVSDSTGKLAVLLPPAYAGNAVSCTLVGPDGRVLATGADGGVANGDRQHYRFDKPGAKYPPGTRVVVALASGETATWTVQRTGARND